VGRSAVGDSCLLKVTHDQPAAKCHDQLYGGWPMILSGLKTLLETGRDSHDAGIAALGAECNTAV